MNFTINIIWTKIWYKISNGVSTIVMLKKIGWFYSKQDPHTPKSHSGHMDSPWQLAMINSSPVCLPPVFQRQESLFFFYDLAAPKMAIWKAGRRSRPIETETRRLGRQSTGTRIAGGLFFRPQAGKVKALRCFYRCGCIRVQIARFENNQTKRWYPFRWNAR